MRPSGFRDGLQGGAVAHTVYLAPDPDREGEAISAHLAMVLSKPSRFVEAEPPGKQNGKAAEAKEAEDAKAGKKSKTTWRTTSLRQTRRKSSE